MTLSIAQTPQYPIPGRDTKITFTASSGANFVRVWVTDAPLGSQLRTKLVESDATQTEVHAGDINEDPTKGTTWRFNPDRGGKYLFTAQEYAKGNINFGGGYAGDPEGQPVETKVGAQQSISIVVGQKLGMRIGVAPDDGRLDLWVWDSTIRATNARDHGEITPTVTGATSNRARTASLSAAVISALAALDGVTTPSALGSPQTVALNMFTRLNQHFANVASHASSDSVNEITPAYTPQDSPKSLQKSVNEMLRRLKAHMESDLGDGSGPGGGAWHTVSGDKTADFEHSAFAESISDQDGAVVGMSEIFRAYETHRLDAKYHAIADGLFPLDALPPLLNVHRRYMESLAATSPTAAPTDNPGITPLVHGAGMKEV